MQNQSPEISGSDGVMLIATGPHYTQAAIRAARNVRQMSPGLGVAIATDKTDIVPADLASHILKIDDPHPRSKVDMMSQTPFERTLYIDTDIRLTDDISDIFALLDRFDLAVAHAHARRRDQTREMWRIELPEAFCQMNAGVMLFRKSPEVETFLRDWSTSYAEANFRKDQVTLRELLWLSPLKFYVLPPEFNVRYSRYAHFWDPEEAAPRVLHYARFHDDGRPWKVNAKRKLKELRADYRAAFRTLWGAVAKTVTFGGSRKYD